MKDSTARRPRTKRPADEPESLPSPKRVRRNTRHEITSRPEPDEKRQRTSPTDSTKLVADKPATDINVPHTRDPVAFWAEKGYWPKPFAGLNMDHLLARKKSLSNLSRKRSNSALSSTPSDQRPREEKNAPYRDTRYELLLETKDTYMDTSELDITDESKCLVSHLLDADQPPPKDTIFDDCTFLDACRNLHGRNEARIIQDISRLIVPSAETLALRDRSLRHLAESVNEGWNNSIPLTGKRPQPDYSLGFRRDAFTEDRLAKLGPFIGDFIAGDLSYFMATYAMYFPFLTCEVKCGTAGLDVADRQNAHSMAIAVRAVTELFRAVNREGEVHRQILAFSISHDHRSVRIYGHYPVIYGKKTKYYRHPIYTFDFTTLNGRDRWIAYRFTRNVYDTWVPVHFKNICSAIDQLPSELDFDVPSVPGSGPSQGLESHHPAQWPRVESMPAEQVHKSSNNTGEESGTPGTSFTNSGVAKKKSRGSRRQLS